MRIQNGQVTSTTLNPIEQSLCPLVKECLPWGLRSINWERSRSQRLQIIFCKWIIQWYTDSYHFYFHSCFPDPHISTVAKTAPLDWLLVKKLIHIHTSPNLIRLFLNWHRYWVLNIIFPSFSRLKISMTEHMVWLLNPLITMPLPHFFCSEDPWLEAIMCEIE